MSRRLWLQKVAAERVRASRLHPGSLTGYLDSWPADTAVRLAKSDSRVTGPRANTLRVSLPAEAASKTRPMAFNASLADVDKVMRGSGRGRALRIAARRYGLPAAAAITAGAGAFAFGKRGAD